ncbi:hypothetical protein SCOR_10540 [Sulfidibacter corallicola]
MIEHTEFAEGRSTGVSGTVRENHDQMAGWAHAGFPVTSPKILVSGEDDFNRRSHILSRVSGQLQGSCGPPGPSRDGLPDGRSATLRRGVFGIDRFLKDQSRLRPISEKRWFSLRRSPYNHLKPIHFRPAVQAIVRFIRSDRRFAAVNAPFPRAASDLSVKGTPWTSATSLPSSHRN